ncbi:MAG: C4-dicarboxylate TRAP transporter substrate-binding protein [Eubacteriales bacterium]|jgi:tripartite ATP-independent transporter DctP family solute receptor
MKKVFASLLCLCVCLGGLTACNNSANTSTSTDSSTGTSTSSGGGESAELKMSYTIAGTETVAQTAQEMAQEISDQTDGKFVIQNYPNGELAGDVDALEQISRGANLLTFGTPDFLATYVPDLGILDGPFLFESSDQFAILEESDWFQTMRQQLEEKGIKNLSMRWYFGARHLTHNTGKEVSTPDQLSGMRIRSASSPTRVAMIEAMGATVTQMNWNEVYSALNQGVMDGCEAPLSTLYSSKIYEVCKNISLTGHIRAIWSANVSTEWYNSVSADYQTLLTDALKKYGDIATERVNAEELEWQKTLEAEGVVFTEVDQEAFKSACEVVYTKIDGWSDNLYETVKAALGEA